ncbi:uncharacterized protein [Dysidea avara]|uniref:uncharacterized protein n=1 Tax=Dysidea avara TaxID=196820 RepID=UPI003318BE52
MASKPVVLPEIFQGNTSWDDWLEHFDRVAAVNDWTANATKLKWLKVRITGKAAAALRRLPDETKNDYGALTEALKKRTFRTSEQERLVYGRFTGQNEAQDEDWASFGDSLRLLTEKAYPGLQDEAQEVLALNHFLAQLEHPQINFAVRQKQPKTVDQAVQYTMEAESYLNSYKRTTNAMVPTHPGLKDPDQSVAAAINREDSQSMMPAIISN